MDINDQRVIEAQRRREKRLERLRRHIETGRIDGEIRSDGSIKTATQKNTIHWYDTRTLVDKVSARFNSLEKAGEKRMFRINGKWQLQIRGKHLRRLLKAMPTVKQVGRYLVDTK